MVDVFGGSVYGLRGKRGPPGPKGCPGSIDDMCKWLPKTMLKSYQENEESGCYFITDLKKDILKNRNGEIIEWVSRSDTKINLKGKVPTKDIVKLPNDKGYALSFHKTHYRAGLKTFMTLKGYGFLCITFRTKIDKEQILLSNFDDDNPDNPFNQILASKSSLFIVGFVDEKKIKIPIMHDCSKWTTFFVDWVVEYTDGHGCITGTYMIDGNKKLVGTFKFTRSFVSGDFIDVGSEPNDVRSFTGDIRALEIYTPFYGKIIPQSLKELVIQNQLIDDGDENMI